MFKGLVVDGLAYDVVCSVGRTANIKSTELSGTLYNLNKFNDTIATYMQYDVSIVVPAGQEARYAELYEVLTEPVGSHSFYLPYNQQIIEVIGSVSTVSDDYVKDINVEGNTVKLWRKTSFTVTATTPIKRAAIV